MGWSYSHTFKAISIAVLFFFSWTFGGLVTVAYAAKVRGRSSGIRDQEGIKGKKPEAKLSKSIEEIGDILHEVFTDINTKKGKLKAKKTEIETFDKEIRKQFAETEEELRHAGMPEKILKRHKYFLEKYDHDFNKLIRNLEAIENSVDACQINAAIEKAKIFLEKLKPPEKQKPLDPDRLSHRKGEPVRMKPRTVKQIGQNTAVSNRQEGLIPPSLGDTPLSFQFGGGEGNGGYEDSLLLTAFNSQLEKYFPPFIKGPACAAGRGEGGLEPSSVLFASNGSLSGLLSSESEKPSAFSDQRSAVAYNAELLTQESFFLAQAGDSPTSDDLMETIEVQFTPAIVAKAAELGHDPVRIYNWVRNNVGFVANYGSIQGADMCLQTKQCNAFDTSSLLIALLRSSNIHARYVEGTVEVPIDKVMNWVGGFTNPMTAIDLMAAGGIPTSGIASGGEITKVRFEHIWVEAWIDYIPYRGVEHDQGDTWIPLDASFKQYKYTDSLDVDAAVPRDVDALLNEVESQSIIDFEIPSITGMPTAMIENQLTDFLTQLNDYVAANYPGNNNYYKLNKTIHGGREVNVKNMRFLPNSLEAKVIAKLGEYSELPDTLRHNISFDLGSADFWYEVSLAYTTSLPEIAGKRITLSYTPATPDDAQVMSKADSILGFPVYLVKVIPELKIEGQTVASGEIVGMGIAQSFEMAFSQPHGMIDRVENTIQAGEYYAVGLDINNISFQYLYDRVNSWDPDNAEEKDDRLGELLHIAAVFHFARLDHFMNELSRSSNIVSLRHLSESMVGMSFNADYIFNTPTNISSLELTMDVDRDVIYPASRANDSDAEVWFMVQKGLYSSNLEHFTFEELMGFDSVSTVRLLDLANQQNVPIYIINSENSDRVPELQISPAEKQNILNAIHSGKTVIVPKTEIKYIDYSGIGYAVIDPETGAGAYMIGGGLNGGSTAIKDDETVRERVADLVDLGQELIGQSSDWTGIGYEISIQYILKKYPHIADTPATEFPNFDLWSKMVLNFKDIAECDLCDDRIKIIMGQQILYYTLIMTMDVTDPVY